MTIPHFTDHAANERTFLAWVRTALAVVAFGFLVERFDLFLSYLTRSSPQPAHVPVPHFAIANVAGLTLIVLGIAMMVVAAWRFLKTARDIENPNVVADSGDRIDITFVVLLILLSAGLLFYLTQALTQNA